jgi:hypothetical protein
MGGKERKKVASHGDSLSSFAIQLYSLLLVLQLWVLVLSR